MRPRSRAQPGDVPRPAGRARALERRDREAVLRIVAATGFFTAAECQVAAEVLDDALARPGGDYHVFVAETAGEVQGYVCFGPTPLTEGTWDLYWIAVDPQSQGKGSGRALTALAEERVAAAGGRLLLVETSGSDLYAPTRAFYETLGYREVSRIEDFYRLGDAKVTYAKRLV